MIEVLLLLAIVGIVVFIVVVLYLFKKRFKIAFLIAIAYVVIGALSFLASVWYVDKVCGPNPKDVAIMKPMAKKISEYIIKNGIPKSLKDIPGLPYELECGEVKEYIFEEYSGDDSVEGTKFYNREQTCHFKNIKISYRLQNPLKENISSIFFNMLSSNKTIYTFGVYKNDRGKFVASKADIGSYKTSGICNPMRQ